MASQSKESEKVYLTDDLVEGILVRLPAESLVKFKLVCKSWLALITDRQFVNRQLQVTINNRRITSSASFLTWTQLYFLTQRLSLLNICDSDEHGNYNIPCSIAEPDLPVFLRTAAEDYFNVVVTHCNGLISIAFPLRRFQNNEVFPKTVLCNPILKELRFLPNHFDSEICRLIGGGFGYDSTTDDYKFVRMYESQSSDEDKVWVYNLRTDSWRMVRIQKIGIGHFENKGVYCRDAHYWLTHRTAPYRFQIAAFDYSREELHVISLPKSTREISYRLAKWKESVVLFSVNEDWKVGNKFEMWVMVGRFGGSDGDTSWVRHLTIGPLKNCSPLEFWKDDELLLISNDRHIVSYNLDTEDCRTVPDDLDVVRFLNGVESYVESLVSPSRVKNPGG